MHGGTVQCVVLCVLSLSWCWPRVLADGLGSVSQHLWCLAHLVGSTKVKSC